MHIINNYQVQSLTSSSLLILDGWSTSQVSSSLNVAIQVFTLSSVSDTASCLGYLGVVSCFGTPSGKPCSVGSSDSSRWFSLRLALVVV